MYMCRAYTDMIIYSFTLYQSTVNDIRVQVPETKIEPLYMGPLKIQYQSKVRTHLPIHQNKKVGPNVVHLSPTTSIYSTSP